MSLVVLAICVTFAQTLQAQTPVASAATRDLDDEVGFAILVWQYQTNAMHDEQLYRKLGLTGFHIDRGRAQQKTADWANENKFTYYIDHAAGKGTLHLTDRTGLSQIPRDGTKAERPRSLALNTTLNRLRNELDQNLPDAVSNRTLAIALDDEVSLGTFNAPLELDFSPAAIKEFQTGSSPSIPTKHRSMSLGRLRLPMSSLRRRMNRFESKS